MATKPNGRSSRRVVRVATARERGADEFLTKPVDFPKLRRDIMAVKAEAMRRNA